MIDPNELDAAAWARRVLTETDSGREAVRAAWARRVLTEIDSGREAVRALFYAHERGLPPALPGRFDIQTCGNWEYLTPKHQSWIGPPPLRGSAPRSRPSGDKARA
jgi:hypothetical protein